MRIVHLTPGTGNFYCGTCMRDNALVAALQAQGHDAMLLPMYLPHFVDEQSVAEDAPLFFGGINVYLQQKAKFFRHSPAWLDGWLDSPALLNRAASRAGMTSARDLGDLTLSMLQGEEGHQAKELEKVIAWLSRKENRPDVVCLSNVLLIGLARRIREALGVPVVCTLQGEDSFVDALPEPDRCWQALRERAADVSVFVAVSRYYGAVMTRRLGLAPERVEVVYNGINLAGYTTPAPGPRNPPVIGYLARMHPCKGLDVLVEAFILLKARKWIPGVRLRIAGGQTEEDRRFVDGLKARLFATKNEENVQFLPNLNLASKQAFLRSLNVLSVPATHGESFGLYVLEALASGIPVVQPAHGAFPELIEATGGGILYKPGDPEALATALEEALSQPAHLAQLGRCGMQQVHKKFTSETMARGFAEVCERALQSSAPRA